MVDEKMTGLIDRYQGSLAGRYTGRHNAFLLGLCLAWQCASPALGTPPQTSAASPKASAKETLGADTHHLRQGMALVNQHDPEAAAAEFNQCHDMTAVSDIDLLRIANTYALVSQHAKALKIVSRVFDHAKTGSGHLKGEWQAFAYQIRADSSAATGKTSEALADYLKWAELSPKLAAVPLSKAANMMCRQNEYDQAIKLFNRAVAADSQTTDPAIYMYRGVCFEKMGRWTDAVRDFSESIRRGEASAKITEGSHSVSVSSSYLQRSKCYDKLGKKDLAEADRKMNEKMSRGLADDLFGGARELPISRSKSPTPKAPAPK
jgi:tetratricopeptide (TPR) repeat protein